MPVTAAGLADVGARYPHPFVLGGRSQHALQKLAVAGLELGTLSQSQPCLPDPRRQRIADRLQVAQVEGPRLAGDGGDTGVDLHTREGLGEQRGELRFEASYLTP